LNLALDAPPRFAGVSARQAAGRLLIAPSMQHVERAYNHAKYGEYSAAPIMEVTIPTMLDPGLAPVGGHVLSAIVQYAPYALRIGWDAGRQPFLDRCLATLEIYAPGLTRSISSAELLCPQDLEAEFRMHGGHWHHGELAFDQFFMVRPVPGAAQHVTPVPGLYLCGAGCHPGGGVMGVAGRNAARQILRQAA
jgi:phytoene dehydrogenase-like protein